MKRRQDIKVIMLPSEGPSEELAGVILECLMTDYEEAHRQVEKKTPSTKEVKSDE